MKGTVTKGMVKVSHCYFFNVECSFGINGYTFHYNNIQLYKFNIIFYLFFLTGKTFVYFLRCNLCFLYFHSFGEKFINYLQLPNCKLYNLHFMCLENTWSNTIYNLNFWIFLFCFSYCFLFLGGKIFNFK